MKKLLFFIVLCFFISCEQDDMNKPSTYPQLNGVYVYEYYNSWNSGLYEDYRYEEWKFDQTRQVWKTWKYWSYTSNGWNNALKELFVQDYEWKIENGKFIKKYWYTPSAPWDTLTFQFIDSNHFKLDGKLFTRN